MTAPVLRRLDDASPTSSDAPAGGTAVHGGHAASPLAQLLGAGLDRLVAQLAATAVQRDREGGHAAEQRELIRASGLLALTIPETHGGLGGGIPEFFQVVRRIARVDSALAHVLAFHHLQLYGVSLYGGPAATAHGARHLRETAEQRLFWGNARVHTLHDPVDYKLRDLGRFFLDDRIPDPTAYS